MNRFILFSSIVAAIGAQMISNVLPTLAAQPLCSDAWYQMVEENVETGDGHGHGPDIGSAEWRSVIEFKLGVRGKPQVPERDSEDWCRYIDHIVSERAKASGSAENPTAYSPGQGPSYSCEKVTPGSIEAIICDDKELSALDRKLSAVYAAASRKAIDEKPPRLKAEQRGWIKGRDECWKSDDKAGCVREEYLLRTAELQARYRLVTGTGPIFYACESNPADEVVVTFFQTEPPTLIAERGDSVSLMYLQPSGSGSQYRGGNEMFWEHQGEALIQWGFNAPEMRCKKK